MIRGRDKQGFNDAWFPLAIEGASQEGILVPFNDIVCYEDFVIDG